MTTMARSDVERQRVLFVDDEPHLLSALRRLLLTEKHRWDMKFVVGGEAALEAVEHESFDVVVTDMRMPGIDGTAVLREVERCQPATYRMVLSGYAEAGVTSTAMEVAQRFLAKPCDPAELIQAIEQGCNERYRSGNRP
jgi:DNA-binding NtrC family response regulator